MRKLSIQQTLREAVLLPFRHWRHFSILLIGSVVLVSVTLAAVLVLVQQEWMVKVLGMFIGSAIVVGSFTMLAISCHRFILLGDSSISSFQIWNWRMRETRFLLCGLALAIVGMFCVFAPLMLGVFIGRIFEEEFKLFSVIALLSGGSVGFVICCYLTAWLSLIFPAVAIDKRPTEGWIEWSSALTSNNEWRLATIVMFIPLPFWWVIDWLGNHLIPIVREAPIEITLATLALRIAIIGIELVFQVAILSVSYRELSAIEIAAGEQTGS